MKKLLLITIIITLSNFIVLSSNTFSLFSHKDHIFANSLSTGMWGSSSVQESASSLNTFLPSSDLPPVSFPSNNYQEDSNQILSVEEEPSENNLFKPVVNEPVLNLDLEEFFEANTEFETEVVEEVEQITYIDSVMDLE